MGPVKGAILGPDLGLTELPTQGPNTHTHTLSDITARPPVVGASLPLFHLVASVGRRLRREMAPALRAGAGQRARQRLVSFMFKQDQDRQAQPHVGADKIGRVPSALHWQAGLGRCLASFRCARDVAQCDLLAICHARSDKTWRERERECRVRWPGTKQAVGSWKQHTAGDTDRRIPAAGSGGD